MIKICGKCKIEKELKDFYKCKNSRDGLQHYCKECCRSLMRTYRKTDKNKKYRKEYSRTEKAKERKRKYEQTDKYKEYRKQYNKSEEYKKSKQKYNQSEKGKEKRRACQREDYRKNRERYLERVHKYHYSEKGQESYRRYRKTDKYKETIKKTNSTPVAKARKFIARVYYRLKESGYDTSKIKRPKTREQAKILLSILETQPFCQFCKTIEDLTWDHIIPLTKGGDPFSRENLQRLCRSCNASKGNRL